MSNRVQDAVFNSCDQLHMMGLPADFQQQIKEESLDEWSPGVGQKDPEPLHIKEEQEELWTSLKGERLEVKEETDYIKCSFSAVSVKCEDDEEKPQLHQHQMVDGVLPARSSAGQMMAAAGGAETSRTPDLNTDYCSSSETEVSEDDEDRSNCDFQLKPLSDSRSKAIGSDKKESYTTESGGNTFKRPYFFFLILKTKEDPPSEVQKKTKENPPSEVQTCLVSFGCDDCGKIFYRKDHLSAHKRIHTGEKPFICLVCGKTFRHKSNLIRHTSTHPGQKAFVCRFCNERFSIQNHLRKHMDIHSVVRPFCCDVCEQRFSHKSSLYRHMRIHTRHKLCG